MMNVESAANWLLYKLETHTYANIIKIYIVLWGIWLARNKKVCEDKHGPLQLNGARNTLLIIEWRDET